MISAVILAAGEGTRMGAVKPLLPIDGKPALSRVIGTACAAGVDEIVVVLGHAADEIQGMVDLSGCRVIRNPDYKTGMASSLRVGIQAVSAAARGILILHADMPYIAPETIGSIIATARTGARLVAPTYQGARGFPVYVDRVCFPGLISTLVGEVGARAYISAHPDDLVAIPVLDPGTVVDLDTPNDVQEAMLNAGLRQA